VKDHDNAYIQESNYVDAPPQTVLGIEYDEPGPQYLRKTGKTQMFAQARAHGDLSILWISDICCIYHVVT
jgi:hypothetical protein